jgi:hypothetical protein
MTSSKKGSLFVSSHRRSWLLAPVFVTVAFLSGQAAYADLREQAAYYHSMWRQTDARAASVAATNPFAALGYVPEIAKWKRLYDQAMAELAKQERANPEKPTTPEQPEPDNETPPNRGYGPPRTGLDWQPLLADLRPKAVASSLRQGDNFASKGDWGSALKDYDLASRIDPKNQLAQKKANEAREKLRQAQEPHPTTAPLNSQAQPSAVPPGAPTSQPAIIPPGGAPAPLAPLPTVPTSLPGSQGLQNAAGAPGFHPTQEQLMKRIQLDDESQQSVGSFFKSKSGGK